MTFTEFQERYQKELVIAQKEYEDWVKEEEEKAARKELLKSSKPTGSVISVLSPMNNNYDNAEFLLEQLLVATSLMTVAMNHLHYYASAKGKSKILDKNDQQIMQQTADEMDAFINLMEGEGIAASHNE